MNQGNYICTIYTLKGLKDSISYTILFSSPISDFLSCFGMLKETLTLLLKHPVKLCTST